MSRLDEIRERYKRALASQNYWLPDTTAVLDDVGYLLGLFQPQSPAEPPVTPAVPFGPPILTPVLIQRKREPTFVVAAFHLDGAWRTVELGEEVPDIVAWYNVLAGLE